MIDLNLQQSLLFAREGGIAPVWFFYVKGRDRVTNAARTMGLWSGDENVSFNVQTPDGAIVSRDYLGGCNLHVDNLKYVADLTDEPVNVSISQIADATQQLVRGYDVRGAYCEIHATTRVGGALSSDPQLQWVGVVDDVLIGTPEAGGEGSIGLVVRSELMSQLTSINPAKSSNSHQRKRRAGDRFSEYAGTIKARRIQWYHRDE